MIKKGFNFMEGFGKVMIVFLTTLTIPVPKNIKSWNIEDDYYMDMELDAVRVSTAYLWSLIKRVLSATDSPDPEGYSAALDSIHEVFKSSNSSMVKAAHAIVYNLFESCVEWKILLIETLLDELANLKEGN